MNSSAPGNAEGQVLAARFADGPHVSASGNAEQIFGDWLSELEPAQSAALDQLLAYPSARRILLGIAEFSPYLFDLVRADAARLIRCAGVRPGVAPCVPDRERPRTTSSPRPARPT